MCRGAEGIYFQALVGMNADMSGARDAPAGQAAAECSAGGRVAPGDDAEGGSGSESGSESGSDAADSESGSEGGSEEDGESEGEGSGEFVLRPKMTREEQRAARRENKKQVGGLVWEFVQARSDAEEWKAGRVLVPGCR